MFQKKRKQILRKCLSLALALSMTVPVQASALTTDGVAQPVGPAEPAGPAGAADRRAV